MAESANEWGIVLDDADIEEDENADFMLFYDCQLALEVFTVCQTQWNVSMDGITGLNYAGVLAVIELYAKKKTRLDLLHKVSAIERGFLKAVNEKRKESSSKK